MNTDRATLREYVLVLLLHIVGYILGGTIGYAISVSGKELSQIILFSFITHEIAFGILIGLLIQSLSIICIWMLIILGKGNLYVPTAWLLTGISSGVLASLNVVDGIIAAAGFILPYAFVSLVILPLPIAFLIGTDATALLAIDGIKLLILFAATLLTNYVGRFWFNFFS